MKKISKLMLAFMVAVTAFDVKLYSENCRNEEKMYIKTLSTAAAGSIEPANKISIVYSEKELAFQNSGEKASDTPEMPENNTEPHSEPETKSENTAEPQTSEMTDLEPYIDSVKGTIGKIRDFYQECIENSADKQFSSLYIFEKDVNLLNDGGKVIGCIKKGELYTGTPDPETEGMILIDYQYSTIPVKAKYLKKLEETTILPTAAIGQMGGKIYGITACGPTAVTILIDWEKQTDTSKDDLIRYSKENKLEDQGAIDRPHGGMTAPRLIELTEGYYKGEITAKNIYNDKPLTTINEQIDSGHRALVAVRYTSAAKVEDNNQGSGVHFIVICGYDDTDDERYYYYADPYFGDGGYSLLKVRASKLERSMKQVNSEPKTLIVLT